MPSFIRPHPNGVYVSVKVQPRSSVNEIAEVTGAELKVRVTAPPVDSAANEALLRFLADRLGCSRNALEITRGRTSRHKVIFVSGVGADTVEKALTPD